MSKKPKPATPAKKRSAKAPTDEPAAKKTKLADDDLYEQGDMATPERDPPYEDGL